MPMIRLIVLIDRIYKNKYTKPIFIIYESDVI